MTFFFTLSVILVGTFLLFYLCKALHLPALLGYLLWGMLLGYLASLYPEVFDSRIMSISAEIRKIALIIILVKAGLSLNLTELKRVGRPAILMSFVPATVEMCTIGVMAPLFFPISYTESFLLGSVLGAVSPAVVIPMMTRLLDEKRGTKDGVPQMIIAGSSIDDIIMIVFYQAFMAVEKGGSLSFQSFLSIPVSIFSGIAIGVGIGFLFSFLFRKFHFRDSMKLILIFAVSFGLTALEEYISYLTSPLPSLSWISFSSLLAIITSCILLNTRNSEQSKRLALRNGKMWVLAEMLLFVFVGMSIKVSYAASYFPLALALLACSLVMRSLAVSCCLIKTKLNAKERGFSVISYLPKATVQAAIGGGLLDYGNQLMAQGASNAEHIVLAGEIVLSVSVVAILLTAPLSAILMNLIYTKMLPDDSLQERNGTND